MARTAIMRAPRVIEDFVDNPLTTYAQTLYEAESGVDRPGKIKATINRRTVYGGLYRFHASAAEMEAAKRYKMLADQSMIGGVKAMDFSREPVDGGGATREPLEVGADARKLFIAARDFLGAHDRRRWDFVVLEENFPTAYAVRFLYAADGRSVTRAKEEVRLIARRLARHMRLE